MVPPFRRRGASVRWRINLLLPPHRRWRDGKNLRKAPPFDSVGGPGGLDDTVALSTMQDSVGQLPLFNLVGRPEGLEDTVTLSTMQDSFGRLPLFNLVGRPEGLDDTDVQSITQESTESFGQPPLLDRFVAKG